MTIIEIVVNNLQLDLWVLGIMEDIVFEMPGVLGHYEIVVFINFGGESATDGLFILFLSNLVLNLLLVRISLFEKLDGPVGGDGGSVLVYPS